MEESSGKKRNYIIVLSILLLTVGLLGGGWFWYQTTHYVSTDDARISGTIVNISAKYPGKVVEVLVKEGDSIFKGQPLARIDPREILAQRNNAEAALAAAKANYAEKLAGSRPQQIEQLRAALNKANANLENQYKNYLRMHKLYYEGAISASQQDTAKSLYLMSKAEVNEATENLNLALAGTQTDIIRYAAEQVKQQEAVLEQFSVMEEYTIIYSPVDGIVALKSINPGEVVSAGQSILSVVDGSDIKLTARIEETSIGKIKNGQSVDFTIDGYSGHIFHGNVYDIGIATNSTFSPFPTENASGNFTKVTQRIPIKITLPDPAENIIYRPGMQAVIKIHVQP